MKFWLFVITIILWPIPCRAESKKTSETLTQTKTAVPHSDCHVFPDQLTSATLQAHFTIIDLKSQHLAGYEYGKLIRICDISAAKKGYEDLIGGWTVIKKSKNAVSSVWKDDSGNPFAMPWAVAIGGGYWIHQGQLPGYPASHGCVRMRETNAQWYFNWSKTGDKGFSYPDFSKK
jgi:hypothetical protein